MSDVPFFSVIIPTYNRQQALARAVACVLRQRYPAHRYELLVVDDGSCDGTAAYLQQLAQQEHVRFVRQRNAGPAAARNTGARLAQGDVLVFTDDDCQPEPDWLAELAAGYAAMRDERLAAIGGPIRISVGAHWLHQLHTMQDQHSFNDTDPPVFLDTANAAYRRDVFWQVGGFHAFPPIPGGEDLDLSLRCLAAGYTLRSTPRAIVWHMAATSLRGLLRHSWLRGISMGYVRVMHPTYQAFAPATRWSARIRAWLERLITLTQTCPPALRPLAQGSARAVLMTIVTGPEILFFLRTQLPDKASHYQMQGMARWNRRRVLMIDSLCYLLYWVGRVVGAFRCVVRDAGWQVIRYYAR